VKKQAEIAQEIASPYLFVYYCHRIIEFISARSHDTMTRLLVHCQKTTNNSVDLAANEKTV
jgi:predicted protein tyrosine phosphatase